MGLFSQQPRCRKEDVEDPQEPNSALLWVSQLEQSSTAPIILEPKICTSSPSVVSEAVLIVFPPLQMVTWSWQQSKRANQNLERRLCLLSSSAKGRLFGEKTAPSYISRITLESSSTIRVRWRVRQSQVPYQRSAQSCGPGSHQMLEASPNQSSSAFLYTYLKDSGDGWLCVAK